MLHCFGTFQDLLRGSDCFTRLQPDLVERDWIPATEEHADEPRCEMFWWPHLKRMLKMHAHQVKFDKSLGRKTQHRAGFWETKFSPFSAAEFCELADVDAIDEPEEDEDGCMTLQRRVFR